MKQGSQAKSEAIVTTTKQPSAAAMEAARALYPFGAEPAGRHEQMIRVVAAIIDRHLSGERQEVREVLGQLLALRWGELRPVELVARAESLLARIGGE